MSLIDAHDLWTEIMMLPHNGDMISSEEVEKAIVEAPTVDAVPVVHGRCDWCNGEYHTKIMATAIRYHSNGNMDGYEMKVNYCPHCGAKMDGGNEE